MRLLQFGVLIIILLPYGLELRVQLLCVLSGPGWVLEATVLCEVVIGVGICVLGQLLMPLLSCCLQLLLFALSVDGGRCKLAQAIYVTIHVETPISVPIGARGKENGRYITQAFTPPPVEP